MFFDILKNFGKLKELHDKLSNEKIVIERDGIKLVMNGKMEIEDLVLNPELPVVKQQQILKQCFNTAVREIQMALFKKISNEKI